MGWHFWGASYKFRPKQRSLRLSIQVRVLASKVNRCHEHQTHQLQGAPEGEVARCAAVETGEEPKRLREKRKGKKVLRHPS
eukprot:1158177-Pelagomonas_calceolata.AAC.5